MKSARRVAIETSQDGCAAERAARATDQQSLRGVLGNLAGADPRGGPDVSLRRHGAGKSLRRHGAEKVTVNCTSSTLVYPRVLRYCELYPGERKIAVFHRRSTKASPCIPPVKSTGKIRKSVCIPPVKSISDVPALEQNMF